RRNGGQDRLRRGRKRHRSWGRAPPRSRQPVHGRSLPEPDQVLGMAPSFAFVAEPETNGVAERFFRTFKEQVVYGRIYQTIDDVRAAVRTFFERYNHQWLIEKNGLRSPHQTRLAWEQA